MSITIHPALDNAAQKQCRVTARYQMPRKDMIEDIEINICSKSLLRQALQLKNRGIVGVTLWKTPFFFRLGICAI